MALMFEKCVTNMRKNKTLHDCPASVKFRVAIIAFF